MNNNIFDVMYLCACALHGERPDTEGMDLEMIYKIAKSHTIAALVSCAMDQSSCKEDALLKKFQTVKMKSIRKNMLLEDDRKKLFQYLDENKIRHVALKGSVLKDLYPKEGMRQMADNDILFDGKFQKQIKEYMVQKGYECRFSDEDFYVYMITHAKKHFSGGGTGLRTLCDCYVYLWKKGDTLNREYIDGELEKLGLTEFEKILSALAGKLLSDTVSQKESDLTEKEVEMLAYISGSGTYGTLKNFCGNLIEKTIGTAKPDRKQKMKYLMGRIFPGDEWYEKWCPFCYKHKFARPFFVVFRIFRGIFCRQTKVKTELKVLKDK